MAHEVTIRSVTEVARSVRRFVVDKPAGYRFEAGQATTVALEREGWRDEQRPFTFTSLPGDRMLEFTIKIYPEHDGVTDRLAELAIGDRIRIEDAGGAITPRGPGTFIAGGAGITPFIAIIRQLAKDDELAGSRLLFSNHAAADTILHDEFLRLLGTDDAIYTLTQEEHPHFLHGRIDEAFLDRHVADWDKPFYLCGPPAMVDDLRAILEQRDIDAGHLVLEG